MPKNFFVDAHHPDWADRALTMTREYFTWMDEQIQATCHASIEELVGMPLSAYVAFSMNIITPKDGLDAVFYLLATEGEPVAMGGLRRLPSGHGEVVRIYTKPEHRGQGYGTTVLEKLIVEAKSRGFKTLNLDTGVFMKNAQSMYALSGFEKCEPYEGAEPPARLLPYWYFMKLELR